MSYRKLSDMPDIEPKESVYEFQFVRRRLSGAATIRADFNSQTQVTMELILCLANEIEKLRQEIKELKTK